MTYYRTIQIDMCSQIQDLYRSVCQGIVSYRGTERGRYRDRIQKIESNMWSQDLYRSVCQGIVSYRGTERDRYRDRIQKIGSGMCSQDLYLSVCQGIVRDSIQKIERDR